MFLFVFYKYNFYICKNKSNKMLQLKLQECFDFFSIKLSGHSCLIKNEIKSFQKLLSKKYDIKTLGDWFCWNYVAFQFEYYSGLRTKMKGKYPANWIFGKKALDRWENKNENWQYFVQKFLSEFEITLPVEYYQDDVDGMFEQERKRFFNTDRGLLHCLQFARYSEKSVSCLICKNKKDCKELWK